MERDRELTIPLAWERLDALLALIDNALIGQGRPTVQRLRVCVAAEELFRCAMADAGEGSGTLTCRAGPSGQLSFRFLRGQTPFLPQLGELEDLLDQSPDRSLSLQVRDGACLLSPAWKEGGT